MNSRAFRWLGAATVAASFGASFTACSSDDKKTDEPTCLDEEGPLDCSPRYGKQSDGTIAPSFHDVYANTLRSCAVPGTCHAGDEPQGGMQLGTETDAYDALVNQTSSSGERRIIPGDTKCGKVIVRLETVGKTWSMPPGAHLQEGDLCAIRHWIKNGAPQ